MMAAGADTFFLKEKVSKKNFNSLTNLSDICFLTAR